MKRALVTGVFGQDGSYLAELLASMGYEVHGVVRPVLSEHSLQLQSYLERKGIRPIVHACDLLDYSKVRFLMATIEPAECYHLAAVHYPAQASARQQIEGERGLFQENTVATSNLLFAIREVSPETRFVLAGSCLMYDGCETSPQDEQTGFCSKSIYGLSKISASQITELFCSLYGLHASTAILYNHESPRRQPFFVTRKIVQSLVRVKRGAQAYLELGNLHAVKDWGYARDYVFGMWLMAQANSAKSYIFATGAAHTVEDFVRETADVLGIPHWRRVVCVQAPLGRPQEQTPLIGNPRQAQVELGWSPSVNFTGLVQLMVEQELQELFD